MKIISYNVNGLRSAISKGLMEWLKAADADCVCFQEIKSTPEQLPPGLFEELGYVAYWYPAQKKGYSGVAVLSRIKPLNVHYGMGIQKYDDEGRVLRLDFPHFSLMNVYMPSGTSGGERQSFKYEWLSDFYEYIMPMKQHLPGLVVVGDYNICHRAIDIHNPVSNAHSSGFLPEERAWMEKFFSSGFVDSFRHFNKEPHHYTWWSYRFSARERNLGWRIDYQSVTENLVPKITRALILTEAKHSDHCPTFMELSH